MNRNSINIGQLAVASAPKTLSASGIGSCVIVCLYDKTNQIGGLAHIMLSTEIPESAVSHIKLNNVTEQQEIESPAKYAATGIDNLITELGKKQANISALEAKIIGGSEMFKTINTGSESIGSKNILAVKEKLTSLEIAIVSEDVGGNYGRSVNFFSSNGQIEIKKRMQ